MRRAVAAARTFRRTDWPDARHRIAIAVVATVVVAVVGLAIAVPLVLLTSPHAHLTSPPGGGAAAGTPAAC
jgi:hypothetical protein